MSNFSLQYFWHRIRHDRYLKLISDGLGMCGITLQPYFLVLEGLQDKPIDELETGFAGYELCFLDKSDMANLARIPGRHVPEDELQKRLAEGVHCFALTRNGKPVAFNWIDLNNCNYEGHFFSLKQNEAYLFDAWTLMQCRGKKVAPYLRYQTYKELAKLGVDRFYSVSEYVNTSTRKFKQKLHAREIEFAVYVSIFKRINFRFMVRDLRN